MAQFLLICLILTNVFVVLAMASDNQPAPTPSPSNGESSYKAQAPVIRKLGKHLHQPKVVKWFGAPGPAASLGPSEAPQTREKMHPVKETSSSVQTGLIEPNNEGQGTLLKERHHSIDKSVAGGGVILGGLATTFLVAVFCYIRATGRHKPEIVA